MVWKSVFFSKIWRSPNLSYKFRSNSYSSFRGKWWPTKPAQTEKNMVLLPKQGSCFSQTQLRAGGKILPKKTWMANCSCGFWCASRSLEKMSHFSSGWFHPHPAFRHETHPTTSQVLPQAQLSDFSCPALELRRRAQLVLLATCEWSLCIACLVLMLVILTCGTVCLDIDLGEHKPLYTSFKYVLCILQKIRLSAPWSTISIHLQQEFMYPVSNHVQLISQYIHCIVPFRITPPCFMK